VPSNICILVVDDTDDIREMFRFVLEMRGYKVLEASDGREAISIALVERPDLIFMDLHMPGTNGFEVVQQLRHDWRTKTRPIIAVSALDASTAGPVAIAAGCDAFISKPVEIETLSSIVERFVHK
jgi:CheY-like chemotaxis protein